MEIKSWFLDTKIKGLNLSLEMAIGEYLELSQDILRKNEFQRRRVKTAGKTYSLLRKDLLQGCVMPPIILAVTEKYGEGINEKVKAVLAKGKVEDEDKKELGDFIESAVRSKEFLILDGLQRTYTLLECIADAEKQGIIDRFVNYKIRVEIYIGLTKTGILYRMMTLNTGQSPMTFRQQIEILYYDYIDNKELPDNIEVLKEIDDRPIEKLAQYKFNDVVDMYYSRLTGAAKPIDRETLVSQLRELDFLENFGQIQPEEKDELQTLLMAYNSFVGRLEELSHWQFEPNEEAIGVLRPFGKSIVGIFSKVQPMSGFGAECNRLLKQGKITKIADLAEVIGNSSFKNENPNEAINTLIKILNEISSTATKIGDAQRNYFQLCFRQLLNDSTDSFQDLSTCWINAQEQYNSLY